MAKRRGNNEGTIYQRPNGTWRAQVSVNGKRFNYSGKTRRECQLWLKETLQQVDEGFSFKGKDIALRDFLHNWITSISSSRKRSTIDLYKRTIEKEINPMLGNLTLLNLRPDHIQNLYDLRRKAGQSEHSVHSTHKVLNGAFTHAVRLGLIPRNPAKATIPPKPKHREMNFYDADQANILLNTAISIGDKYYPLYYVAIHTGMRQSELFGLKWSDMDWEHRTLKVSRQLARYKGGGYEFTKPKSSKGIRNIILGPRTMEILKDHRENQTKTRQKSGESWQEHNLIFPSRIGTPIVGSNVRRSFRKLLKESGLPKIRFHDLRHTAASLMLNYGIPVLIVSRRLGHSKPSITMDVYGHLIPGKQEEAAELMDELLTPIDVKM